MTDCVLARQACGAVAGVGRAIIIALAMHATTAAKLVIVNADDFGFSDGITEGILRAHREGIVTSTTIAANMPAAAAAAARLAEAPHLGVGVHLNVSQGPPLSQAGRILADSDGIMRRSAVQVILACACRRGVLDAVEAECDAQIRWVLDRGIRPTHLDSHRHIHAFPPVFARVAALARRYHIPFVRWPREVLTGRWPACSVKQRRVSVLVGFLAPWNAAIGPDLRATCGAWGVAHTGAIDSRWLIRAAAAVRPGATDIMTHPGLGDDLDASMTRLRESRLRELAALCDPAVRDAFRRHGVELIHYGQLRRTDIGRAG